MSRYGHLIVLVITVAMLLLASWVCGINGAWSVSPALLMLAVVLALQAPRAWSEARRTAQ